MTLMPEIHDALARAVAYRKPRRRWLPTGRVALVVVGAVVVTGTAVAATGTWRPLLGSDRHPRPQAARSAVPADQLAALAILRRPQTAADRGPLVQQALRVLDRRTINGIHTDAIRVIFRDRGQVAILVPAERIGNPVHPATLQRHLLCLISSSHAASQTINVIDHGKRKIIHLRAGDTGWGWTCGDTTMLRTSGIQTGTSPDASGGLVVNGRANWPVQNRITLVPDGVARVTVRLRHRQTVTVPVHNNVYRYTTRDSPAFMGTIWYDTQGRRIDHRKHG